MFMSSCVLALGGVVGLLSDSGLWAAVLGTPYQRAGNVVLHHWLLGMARHVPVCTLACATFAGARSWEVLFTPFMRAAFTSFPPARAEECVGVTSSRAVT